MLVGTYKIIRNEALKMAGEMNSGATQDGHPGDAESCLVKMDDLDLQTGREAAPVLHSDLSVSVKQVGALPPENLDKLRRLESESAALADLKDERKCLIAAKERLEYTVQALQIKLSEATKEVDGHLALLADKEREAFELGELNVSLSNRVRQLEEREDVVEQRFQSVKARLEETAAELRTATVGRDELAGEVERLEQDARRFHEEQRRQNWEQRLALMQQKLAHSASQIDELDEERTGLWRNLESRDAELDALKTKNKHLRTAKEVVEGSARALQARVDRLVKEAELHHCGGFDKEAKRWSETQDNLETQLQSARQRELLHQQQLQDVNIKLEQTSAELQRVIASRDGLSTKLTKIQEKIRAAKELEHRLLCCQEDCQTLRSKLGENANQVDLLVEEKSEVLRDLEIRDAELRSLKVENAGLLFLKDGMECAVQALKVKVSKLLQESDTNKAEMEEKDKAASRLHEDYVNQGRCLKELKEQEAIAKQNLENLKVSLDTTVDEMRTAIASRNHMAMELQMLQENENRIGLEHARECKTWKERFSALEQQLKVSATHLDLVQTDRANMLRDLEVSKAELAEMRAQMKHLSAAKEADESYVKSLQAKLAGINEATESMRIDVQEKDTRMDSLVQQNANLKMLAKEQAARESLTEQGLHALRLKLDESNQELQTSVVARDSLLRDVEALQGSLHGMMLEQEKQRQSMEQRVSSFQRKGDDDAEQITALQEDRKQLIRDLESKEAELEGLKDQCKSLRSTKEVLECSVQSLETRLEQFVKEAETNRTAMEEKVREAGRLLELNIDLEKLVSERTGKLHLAEQCIENVKKKLEEKSEELHMNQVCRNNLAAEVQVLQEQARCLRLENEHGLESWERKVGVAERHLKETVSELDLARTEKAALLKELERREGELKGLVIENRQLVSAKEMAEFSVQNLQGKLAKALQEAEANRARIGEMAGDLEIAEAKVASTDLQLEELRVKIENGDRVSVRLVEAEKELHVLQGKLFEADQLLLDKEESLAASEWTVQHLATEISKAKNSLIQRDRKEANMQQQVEDLKMQVRSKEGEVLEMENYLQQQLARDEEKQAELDKLSQKMQELEGRAAGWLKKESCMDRQLVCLEDALEAREMVLGDLEQKLKAKAETQEALEGVIERLKVQVSDAERVYREKEAEMENLCDDLERAKQDGNIAATTLKELQSKMQHLDVIVAQAAASREREHSLEMANRLLQREATIAEERGLARKSTLVQVLKQLEQNRAVNQALHSHMTSTHKRYLDEVSVDGTCFETCDKVWSEEALRRKCKKMRRSCDQTSSSSESFDYTLHPNVGQDVQATANKRGAIRQTEVVGCLSAVADGIWDSAACIAKPEEEAEAPVTALEAALVQLSVQRVTIGQLHQEVVRLKYDLQQQASKTDEKIFEDVGSERDERENVVGSSEEYAHYVELCDSLVR